MACFPMFVDITGKPCLIVGGGRVALRKAKTLLDFGAEVSVVAPEVCPELAQLPAAIAKRVFQPEDCKSKLLVVAATNDRSVNHEIAQCCRSQNIPVNVIDSREESTFLFPAYQKEGDVVAAFSGSGDSPLIAQKLKERTVIPPIFASLNALLGSLRRDSKWKQLPEADRKRLYHKIFDIALERDCLPEPEEIQEWIKHEL